MSVDGVHVDIPAGLVEASEDEKRAAGIVCCANARDRDEALMFLQMIGVAPYETNIIFRRNLSGRVDITRQRGSGSHK